MSPLRVKSRVLECALSRGLQCTITRYLQPTRRNSSAGVDWEFWQAIIGDSAGSVAGAMQRAAVVERFWRITAD